MHSILKIFFFEIIHLLLNVVLTLSIIYLRIFEWAAAQKI